MKQDKKISLPAMAVQNLKARKYRTAFMIFFVVLMSATFFFSTLLMNNLELGIANTTERMGADLIVVPKEGTYGIRDSLFAGKPCSVYFDRGWEEAVRNMEGVERVTPQLYIATLDAGCCDAPVQIIAFDPETDFIVLPWLSESERLQLAEGEIVAGAKVNVGVGDTLRLFETKFQVAGKLEKTGMGYDNSVFMTYETVERFRDSEVAQNIIFKDENEDIENRVSMLMVDATGENETLFMDIKDAYNNGEEVKAYTADSLMSGIASQVGKLSGYGSVLTYIMVVSTALALICIFSITINERKYEFGILLTLGARKSQITKIILSEALMISAIGGVVGIGISAFGVWAFKDVISTKMDIPFFDASMEQVLPVAGICLGIAIVTGIIAALYSSYRLGKGEAYRLIKESE